MSLDVYLKSPATDGQERWTIFIREDGQTKEITLEEWNKRWPGERPTLCHVGGDEEVYSANITHNLGEMAQAAGIYRILWRPDEIGITKAAELIEPLTEGLARLKADPDHFEQFNAPNGWGLYKHFVPFVEGYLEACKEHPEADVSVCR
jgi:hypothetical protein